MKQLLSLILSLLLLYQSFGMLVVLADESQLTFEAEGFVVNLPNPSDLLPAAKTSPAAITLTSFDEVPPADAIAFAKGTSLGDIRDRLRNMSQYFFAYDDLGNDYYLPAKIPSLDGLDTNTTGPYHAWLEPDLEENSHINYILADDLSPSPTLYHIYPNTW